MKRNYPQFSRCEPPFDRALGFRYRLRFGCRLARDHHTRNRRGPFPQMPPEALNEAVFDVPISHHQPRSLSSENGSVFHSTAFIAKPVPHTHFPSGHYRHRRHTLDLNKFLRLPGAFKVIHRSFEGLVRGVIKVADRPRIHDTLRDFSRK
jgi:hypothetical protein